MIREILKDDNPVLRQIAEKVDVLDLALPDLIQDMLDTMFDVNGVGIAAPQIGVSKRVVVIAHPLWQEPAILINPAIVRSSENLISIPEACLSVTAKRGHVKRAEVVEVEYTTLMGRGLILNSKSQFSGLAAIIAQHEIDHLDGVLFTDKLSPVQGGWQDGIL